MNRLESSSFGRNSSSSTPSHTLKTNFKAWYKNLNFSKDKWKYQLRFLTIVLKFWLMHFKLKSKKSIQEKLFLCSTSTPTHSMKYRCVHSLVIVRCLMKAGGTAWTMSRLLSRTVFKQTLFLRSKMTRMGLIFYQGKKTGLVFSKKFSVKQAQR